MKLKINDDKRYNERRSIALTHRKGREERKTEGEKSLRFAVDRFSWNPNGAGE